MSKQMLWQFVEKLCNYELYNFIEAIGNFNSSFYKNQGRGDEYDIMYLPETYSWKFGTLVSS